MSASSRRRERRMPLVTVLCVACFSMGLVGCVGVDAARSEVVASLPATPTQASKAPSPVMQGPGFPSPTPDVSADAASMATAQARLAHAPVPPGAVSSTTRPDGVASALAMSFWCQPMADATQYWTVTGMSVTSTVDYLKTHAPQGLTLAGVTGSNAAGDTSVDAKLVEYAVSPDAGDGLIYEVTPVGSGAGIRADSLVTPSNATCATAPPGTVLGFWGG